MERRNARNVAYAPCSPDQESVRRATKEKCALSFAWGSGRWRLMSPPLLATLFFTRDILLVLQQEPQLAADAGIYTAALAFGLPCSLAFQVLRNFSTSLSRPVPPMVVMGLAILFNALGDYAPDLRPFRLAAPGTCAARASPAPPPTFSPWWR